MPRKVYQLENGDDAVDPHDMKGRLDIWMETVINTDGEITNYATFTDLSSEASKVLTRYLVDLAQGKNRAKGKKKGKRSPAHVVNTRYRLQKIFRLLEEETGKTITKVSEKDVLHLFDRMRKGDILNQREQRYKSTGNYAKVFCSFWRWYMRTQRANGIIVADIVENLDVTQQEKPVWTYFTFDEMQQVARSTTGEWRALMYLLFDSGARYPKEFMNIRAKDFKENNDGLLSVHIREETSKTFGRTVKLLFCSEIVRQYLKDNNLKGNDFLFTKHPNYVNRKLSDLFFKVLSKGEEKTVTERNGKGRSERSRVMVTDGITGYDFRHNSSCHYLKIYKRQADMMYRYGWSDAKMIKYYSEFMGYSDDVSEDDLLTDSTKTKLEQELQREKNMRLIQEERMASQMKAMQDQYDQMQAMFLEKTAERDAKFKAMVKRIMKEDGQSPT